MRSEKKTLIDAKKYIGEANIQFIANNLNRLLDENKVSTKVLSDATGISIALINNLKRGDGNPTIGTLNAMCHFFNVSLSELLGLDDPVSFQRNIKMVSIFDLRNAHQRSEDALSTKMFLEAPKNIDADSLFGIIINNNAFLPLYEKGTIFILTTSQVTADGDIVLARIHNCTNVLNRFFIKRNKFFLKNINIDDSIESYDKNDIELFGIVVQIIQKIVV